MTGPSPFCDAHPSGTSTPCGSCVSARLSRERWLQDPTRPGNSSPFFPIIRRFRIRRGCAPSAVSPVPWIATDRDDDRFYGRYRTHGEAVAAVTARLRMERAA